MSNKTRRRLGFAFMVLAVIFAALNLERGSGTAMLAAPVVFLVVGAVMLRKTRASAEEEALRPRRRRAHRSSSDSASH
jgi:uncharacterized membrane protein YhhN